MEPWNESNHQSTTGSSGNSDMDVQQNNEHDENDVWNYSEGYTPLTALAEGEGAMFSTGPSTIDSEPIFVSNPKAFYSEIVNSITDEHEEEMIEEITIEEYRQIADSALLALEESYQRTVASSTNHPKQPDQKDGSFQLPPIVLSNFEDDNQQLKAGISSIPDVIVPHINADAVKRAVDAISLRNTKLLASYSKWESEQKVWRINVPKTHSIIPSKPLAAFWRRTDKAIEASNKLSRSATIAEAVRRLDLLRSQQQLTIHVIGCDAVECLSVEQIYSTFSPFVRWVGAAAECPREILISLIGPSVPESVCAFSPVNLMPLNEQERCRLIRAQATIHSVLYEHYMSDEIPDLVISFNSGIWGYNEWRHEIKRLASHPYDFRFVATAYTLQEAEDDYEVIQDEYTALKGKDATQQLCIWEPEANPFGSQKERMTASALPGHIYKENAAWQAWKL